MSKTLTSSLIIALLVVFQGAGELLAQRAFGLAEKPEDKRVQKPDASSDFKGVRRAVLVGVNEYQHLSQLRFAGADVEALGKALTNAGFSERNVVVIHDKATRSLQPDKQKIMKQIELTLDSAGPDDLVFLAFCMHGVRIDGKTYLAPYEANVPRFDNDKERLDSFIPIDWVYEQLKNCRARMKLMMVDACQERIFDGDTRSLTAEQKRLQSLDELESPKGIMQMVACAPGEYSFESEKLGHGVYTHFLLEALSGKADANNDGIVTLKEADLYVSRETNAYVRAMFKSTQRPSVKGEMEGDLPLAEATQLKQITFPRDIADLHQALDRLADNGILTIQPGVHKISKPLEISKNIQLIGATGDPADVTIESSGEGCLRVTAESARVQGLTLKVKTGGKYARTNSAVQISQGRSEFRKCHITADSGSGVVLSGSSTDPSFVQCRMFNCGGLGIHVIDNGKGTFDNCEAYGSEGHGIQVSDKGAPKITNSKFYNGKGGGILVSEGGRGTFDNCEAYGNTLAGIGVQGDNSDPKVTGCKFYNGKQSGIFVHEGGRGTFDNCEVYGNTLAGIEVKDANSDPKVTGCKFYNGKQSGIFVNTGGRGTFDNCEVYGNTFAGIQVKDTNSDPKVTGCKFYNGKQVGIAITKGGRGTFDNCEAYGNALHGIQVKDTNSAPKVTGCKFYNNDEVGIGLIQDAQGTFANCKVYGNTRSGIDIDQNSKGSFDNCEVYQNDFCGITIQSKSNPTIRNCTFRDNKQAGIAIFSGSTGTYERNTLTGNVNGAWYLDNPGPVRRTGNRPNQ